MRDKEFDKWFSQDTVCAFGCLNKKHPEFRFAPIFIEDEIFVFGPGNPVPAGLEIRAWDGSIHIA